MTEHHLDLDMATLMLMGTVNIRIVSAKIGSFISAMVY